jgi:hypothetical protein
MKMSSVIPSYALIGALLGYAVGKNSGFILAGILGGFIVGGLLGAVGLYFKSKDLD